MIGLTLLAFVAGASAQWFSPMHAPLMHPMMARTPMYNPMAMQTPLINGKQIVIAKQDDGCVSGFKYIVPTPMRDQTIRRDVNRDSRTPIRQRIMPMLTPMLSPFLAPWIKRDQPIMDGGDIDGRLVGERDISLDLDDDLEDEIDEEFNMENQSPIECVPDFNQYLTRPTTTLTAQPKPTPVARTKTAPNAWGTNMWSGMMLNPWMGYPFRYNMGTMGLGMPLMRTTGMAMADPLYSAHHMIAPFTPAHAFLAPVPYIKKA